jgi:hypothetical protein
VGAKLFHVDGRMDGHDKPNSCFSRFCEQKKKMVYYYQGYVNIILPTFTAFLNTCLQYFVDNTAIWLLVGLAMNMLKHRCGNPCCGTLWEVMHFYL